MIASTAVFHVGQAFDVGNRLPRRLQDEATIWRASRVPRERAKDARFGGYIATGVKDPGGRFAEPCKVAAVDLSEAVIDRAVSVDVGCGWVTARFVHDDARQQIDGRIWTSALSDERN
jgi:hypothetical protein